MSSSTGSSSSFKARTTSEQEMSSHLLAEMKNAYQNLDHHNYED